MNDFSKELNETINSFDFQLKQSMIAFAEADRLQDPIAAEEAFKAAKLSVIQYVIGEDVVPNTENDLLNSIQCGQNRLKKHQRKTVWGEHS